MALVLDGTLGITTNSGTAISASTIGVGGATPSASGSGITFPATQSASTDANTLDDYEEGTYTVAVTGFSSNPASMVGTYVKIGRQVTVIVRMPNNGTSNSTAFTVSLPFTIGVSFQGVVGQASDNNVNGVCIIYGNSNNATVSLYYGTGAANWTASGNKIANFTLNYFV